MTRSLRLSALILVLASPTMPGAIQSAARAQAQPQGQPQAGTPAPAAEPQAPVWRRESAQELLLYIEAVGQEGLDPADYNPDRLRAAIAGDEASLSQVASPIFLRLVADLSGGAVRGRSRVDWHMTDSALEAARQQSLLAQVARGGGVGAALDALLPTHPQYAGLKRALAATDQSDEARRDLIRTNMERWRWMPRNLGSRHVLVNVPAFTAALVDEGRVTARHRAVVGATRTPTPQLNATITAVTLNPWWNVPQSIIASQGGRFGPGYQVTRGAGGGISVRQPPGPRNALGRVKIEMPNQYAIYLHDTPSQALFGRPVRAFSHGCIRTQNVRDFAALLLAPTGQWGRGQIDRAIDTGRNQSVTLAAPVPIYIAYFTAAATSDGDIVTYNDVYGRDAPVRQALNRAGGRARIEQASN
ncbi:MAG: L,D-transpeptidase YcbB [Sphingomonadales bacterium]|jgi:murein L,D-transpeptidase YcbB/YkuD|nr:L,D-transpeptidase YcbB [Sphingomonadales bacterium]MEA3042383.1 L,D-transpeptidase YcbB [Sphingomonadales bacterium]